MFLEGLLFTLDNGYFKYNEEIYKQAFGVSPETFHGFSSLKF